MLTGVIKCVDRVAQLTVLGMLAFACWGSDVSRGQGSDQETVRGSDAEKAAYADALAYCRGNASHPEALRADKRVLCLDGRISHDQFEDVFTEQRSFTDGRVRKCRCCEV